MVLWKPDPQPLIAAGRKGWSEIVSRHPAELGCTKMGR
jgi:hypothetical protein